VSEQVHGHEVMQMMLLSGKNYTRSELINEIESRFGTEVTFYTCSAENLSAKGLVDFLEDKGKFIEADGGFNTDPSLMCND